MRVDGSCAVSVVQCERANLTFEKCSHMEADELRTRTRSLKKLRELQMCISMNFHGVQEVRRAAVV